MMYVNPVIGLDVSKGETLKIIATTTFLPNIVILPYPIIVEICADERY